MDVRTFIAEIVDSLSWPVTIVIISWIFRRKIQEIVSNITRLKYKDAEITFGVNLSEAKKLVTDESVTGIEEEKVKLAEATPKGAVIDAWLRVEQKLNSYASKNGFELDGNLSPSAFIQDLKFKMIEIPSPLGFGVQQMIGRLKELRNIAMHLSDNEIGSNEAKDYVSLANRVIRNIEEA